MIKFRFAVSLGDRANDYQRAQAAAAEDAARRLGVEVQIFFADGDAIEQSQQLSAAIQSKYTTVNGIVLQPVGTGMQQLARAATAAGIGWVVMHRDVDYIADLRRTCKSPAFMLSSDHIEEGRIQGKQVAALIPEGGTVLRHRWSCNRLYFGATTQWSKEHDASEYTTSYGSGKVDGTEWLRSRCCLAEAIHFETGTDSTGGLPK